MFFFIFLHLDRLLLCFLYLNLILSPTLVPGHIPEKLTMASFVQLVLLVPMAVIWAIVPNDGIALITDWFINKVVEIFSELPFDRAMEMEADEVGLMMAAKACFDVREAPAVWQVKNL